MRQLHRLLSMPMKSALGSWLASVSTISVHVAGVYRGRYGQFHKLRFARSESNFDHFTEAERYPQTANRCI
jgi:hypothetical protein